MNWKTELARAVAEEDNAALRRAATEAAARTIRFLSTQLYAADERAKWNAIHGLGVVVGERDAVPDERVRELLRRFFWSLNDESGAVPFGVAEAIGEVLAVRSELQPEYLSMLCSLAYHPEIVHGGAIERGVIWALGRLGSASVQCSPEAAKAVAEAAQHHPDLETRKIAAWAVSQFGPC